MAHFYGIVDSHGRSKTDATRQGSKDKGMSGSIRGWDIGANIDIRNCQDRDIVTVYIDKGSNGSGRGTFIAQANDEDGKIQINWKLPKYLNPEDYKELKSALAAIIFHEILNAKNDPNSMGFNYMPVAEAVLEKLGFQLDSQED